MMPDQGNKASLVAASVTREILEKNLQVGMKLPSTRELAKALGVSYLTARAGVAQLVEEGIVELRQGSGAYLARSIRPTTVAIIHDAIYDIKRTYLYHLILAFEKVLKEQGLRPERIATHSDGDSREEHAAIINRWRRGELKGVLIVSRYPARQILDLVASGIPFVWVNESLGKEPVCSVKVDAETAFFSSLQLFRKPEEPAIPLHVIGYGEPMARTWDRVFLQLDSLGAWRREQLHHHLFASLEELENRIDQILAEARPPIAIYLIREMGLPVVLKAIERRGWKFPRDVRLVVEYLVTPSEHYSVAPTGWEWPFEAMARRSLELLEANMRRPLDRPWLEYILPVLRRGKTAIHRK